MNKNREHIFCGFVDIVGICLLQIYAKIGLKPPGNYSASFGTSNFMILLLENPQTSIFTISGFWGFVGNLIYGFNIPKWLIFIIYNRIIHQLIDYEWFHGSWLKHAAAPWPRPGPQPSLSHDP